MTTYLIRRIIQLVPTLILISIISFVIINLPPGDYMTTYIAELESQGHTGAREQVMMLEQRYGLDRPIYSQYWMWITNFVRGDFGESFAHMRPVRNLIGQRFLLTIILTMSTLVFTWMVAIPIGIYSATHQYRIGDHIVTVFGFLGLSIPNFLFALVVMLVMVTQFGTSPGGLFSPEYRDAPWSFWRVVDLFKHLWIPIIVVGTAGTAGLIRIMRSNLLDILNQQFVATARAKGLKESIVIYKHAVRNALHPLVMQLGMSMPQIISGAAITAIVLNLPTIGPLFLNSLMDQDMYLAGSILMLMAIFLVIGNLLADVLLVLVDPRIKYD